MIFRCFLPVCGLSYSLLQCLSQSSFLNETSFINFLKLIVLLVSFVSFCFLRKFVFCFPLWKLLSMGIEFYFVYLWLILCVSLVAFHCFFFIVPSHSWNSHLVLYVAHHSHQSFIHTILINYFKFSESSNICIICDWFWLLFLFWVFFPCLFVCLVIFVES